MGGTARTFKTTWFLNKIVTYNNKETIYFNYVASPVNVTKYHFHSSRLQVNSSWQPRKSDSTTTIVYSPKLLSRIRTSISQIDFSYLFDRLDLYNAGRLNTISVRSRTGSSSTELLHTYQFATSYFGAPSTDKNLLRLRLDDITIVGGDTPNGGLPYKKFDYFSTYQLPSRKSDHFDYWGYHNYIGTGGDPLLNTSLRAANPSRSKANILIGISDLGGQYTGIGYELNEYYSPSTGSQFTGGGLRVESIIRTDPGGQSYTTTYTYENETTGQSFGRATTDSWSNLTLQTTEGPYQLKLNLSESMSNIYDFNGTFIGYQLVITTPPTGGRIESAFQTVDQFPDIASTWTITGSSGNSTPPNMIGIVSSAYKRGMPISTFVYNQAGDPISYEASAYQTFGGARTKHSFGYQYFPITFQWSGTTVFRWFSYAYWTWKENYNLQGVSTVAYGTDDEGSGMPKSTTFTYSPNAYFLVRTATSIDSKGNQTIKTNYYSADPVALLPDNSNLDDYNANLTLRQNNVLAAPYSETYTVNSTSVKSENTYRRVAGTSPVKVRLASSQRYSGTTQLEKVSYTYDSKDNVVTVLPLNGTPTTTIYSYNNSYPIAEIQNADYATVVAALGGQTAVNNFAANYAPTAAQVATFVAPLRTASSLSGALVTTYAYDPGVGMVSKTDPLGKKLTYEYDGLQRLIMIRDHDGNIVEDYKYNYQID